MSISLEERHIEHDIEHVLGEALALFKAEAVLSTLLHHPEAEISAETRAKRAPFLNISMQLIRAERNKRLDELASLIQSLRGAPSAG